MKEAEIELSDGDGYVEARYRGRYSLESYLKRMDASVQGCLDRGGKLLLVDITALEGFAPSTVDLYKIGEHGARISAKLTRVAALGTAGQLGERFATQVASNRGLRIQAFTDRPKALEWLRSKPGPGS